MTCPHVEWRVERIWENGGVFVRLTCRECGHETLARTPQGAKV